MSAAEVELEIPPKLIDVFEGDARYRGAFGGRGSGKCLGRGTLLVRADASLVAVENVLAGDCLLGPNGSVRTVLSTTSGVGPLYRVTQKTGAQYIVNDAHILVLERSASSIADHGTLSKAGNAQRYNGRYAWYDTGLGYSLITAAEYSAKPGRFKAQHFGIRRAVIGESKSLPVDPYLLGLWLGDGSSRCAEITNIDVEVVDYLAEQCAAHGWLMKKSANEKKAPRYYIGQGYKREGSCLRQLRAAGVLGKKHIPEVYFGASLDQRRALLAGLIDTDGHAANGCAYIAQSREHLLNDIVRLAHGLGLKASKAKKIVRCNGRDCEAWTCGIGGDLNTLPVRIARKRAALASPSKNKDWRRTRIDVEPIGEGEYFGFELDGDHLFLLADGTVTHNTRTFALMSAVRGFMWGSNKNSGMILCGREYMNTLEDSSMEEVKQAISAVPWLADYYEIGEKFIRSRDRRIYYAFAGLRYNLDSIKSKARVLLAWVDEAENVSEAGWRKLAPTVRQDDSEIWVTWNPELDGSPTDNRFRKHTPTRSKIAELNYHDNPWFPAVLEEERLNDQARLDDATYAHIWDGAYLQNSSAQIFAKKYKVAEFKPEADWNGPYQGLDWGFSQDPTAGTRWWVNGKTLYLEYDAVKIALELDNTTKFLTDKIPGFENYTTRADNARPESINYVQRHGMPRVTAAKKGKGSVEDGIAHMRSYDEIVIHPRCIDSIREFRLYSYKIDRLSGDVLPHIVDAYNHCIDSGRYALEPLMKRSEATYIPLKMVY